MTTTIRPINSVNLAAIGELVASINEHPATAQTVWKSSVDWKHGFRSEARSREFAPIASDEPIALGGEDTAANPVEQLLGALGNCLAVGYAANASVAGIELDSLTVDLEGDLDLHTFLGLSEGNAGFETITANVRIESSASSEEIQRLHEKVVATSPVGHTLSRAVPISVELT